jgi:hypothetical protein
MQLLALARFPVALCLFDAGQTLSSDAERRCQPVAEKQGGLGAQLPVMSLHALPSVVPAFADVRLHNHWPAGASPPRGYRTNAFGRLAPNNLEASSRIGGSRTGPGRRGWVVCGAAKRSEKVDRRDPVMRANLAAAYGRAGGDDRHAP